MVVDVTNLTDGPNKTPIQVAIYNRTLDPGETIRLPAELVTSKIRVLEKQGLISIGALPAWYASAKTRKGRVLTPEQQAARTVIPDPETLPEVTSIESAVTPAEEEDTLSRRRRRG
jgi:hypothetical protein